MAETFYSVEEANALVPKLRPLLQRIRDTQQALAEDKTVAAVREKASHNGGGLPGRHLSELTKTLERDLKQLQDWGIVLRDPSIGAPDRRTSFLGSFLPFARSAADREKSGDPRASIAERYASREQYMGKFAEAAMKLIQDRFLLREDLPAVLERGRREWDEIAGEK